MPSGTLTAVATTDSTADSHASSARVQRHLAFGWWSLLAWLTVGVGLEALHGFKLGWYLDVGYEMRRLMLTLGHAHGTLLALVNIAAGLTLRGTSLTPPKFGSTALIWSGVLLPLGFILGGLAVHDGDPGLGVLLVPVGGLLLLIGVGTFARMAGRSR